MISCSNLTLRFGKKILFEDVTLKFKPGYVYGIIGANGAGKSTFLKILNGELKPTEGQVSLDSGVKMGWLRQDHYEFDEATVLDTVLMGKKELYDVLKEKEALYAKAEMSEKDGERAAELEIKFGEMDGYSAEAEAGELLEGLGLESAEHGKLMKQLTGGWKLRVLLAQILFAKPDLLLLDDAFSAVDTATEERIVAGLRQALPGTAVLLVSHRISTLKLCRRVLILEDGRITADGTPEELLQQEGFFFEMARREQLAARAGLEL